MFPGLTVSFYIGFLYKLVKGSLAQNADESDKHFKDRVNFDEGLVMVTLGISQALTGLLMNRFGEKFCKFKLATFGTLIAEVAGIFSLVCYFKKSFPLSFVCAALWGCSEAFLQSNTGGIIGKVFPGKVEGFSVYRIFFSIGVVSVLLLGVSLSHVDDYISLIVIVIFQAIFTGVSSNLRNLDKTESGD
jgi:MFS family permease